MNTNETAAPVDGVAHTPGPWRVEAGAEFKIVGSNGQLVLLIGDNRRLIPTIEDRPLLIAAPELLEALQDMLAADDAICENRGSKSDQAMQRIAAIDQAHAAIAKALP